MPDLKTPYEERLADAVRYWLARLTDPERPYTEGVRYTDVRVLGRYPDAVLLIRFEQDEHRGRQFGLRLQLNVWCQPDEIDRARQRSDPLPVEEVAELVAKRLDAELEVGYFTIPTTNAEFDQEGVTWIELEH